MQCSKLPVTCICHDFLQDLADNTIKELHVLKYMKPAQNCADFTIYTFVRFVVSLIDEAENVIC